MKNAFAMALVVACLLSSTPGHAATASWYGNECTGRKMANGQPFNPKALTAASYRYPLGTRLHVVSKVSGRSVDVIVTDRGPAKRLKRELDLSEAAFARISDLSVGIITVNIKTKTEKEKQ